MALLEACPKCGKDDYTSSSGRTLHISQCKGPKTPKTRKTAQAPQPQVAAPIKVYKCEALIGAATCGNDADYRFFYEEDELEAITHCCTQCRPTYKAKVNPTKVVALPKPQVERPAPKKEIKVQRAHKEALDELTEYSKNYWRRKREDPKSITEEDTQILNDMIAEVSDYPGCEISALICKWGGNGGSGDW